MEVCQCTREVAARALQKAGGIEPAIDLIVSGATIDGPPPALPSSEDEQLALALAASRETAGGAAPRLNMLEAAEATALRQSAEEEEARRRAKVDSSVTRLPGLRRGNKGSHHR